MTTFGRIVFNYFRVIFECFCFRSLRDADELLEELLAWLAGLEKTLISLESEPLPDDIETIEALIEDHKCVF